MSPGGAEPREAELGALERRAARPHHGRGHREPGKHENAKSDRRSQKITHCRKWILHTTKDIITLIKTI